MASIIKIKRSGVTGAPTSLKLGELAVSYLAGTQSNGGDRVYVGTGGVDGSGNANNIDVIGGKYFTQLLDHVPGTVEASSALVVDTNKKLNELLVDNITIDGNTVSSTDVNGDIVLDPNGAGKVDVSGAIVTNAGTPSANTDLATKGYVDEVSGASDLTVNGDTGTDTVNLTDSDITFTGGTGITTAVTDNTVTVSITDTGVGAGTFGSTTNVPVITVNAQGQVDSIGTVQVATSIGIDGDVGSADTVAGGETILFAGSGPVETTVSDNTITIAVDDATGAAKGIASFSTDNFNVTSGVVTIKDSGVSNDELANSSIGLNGVTFNLGDSNNINTDGVLEGSTNLYYTDTRSRAALSVTTASGDGSTSYDQNTGEFSITFADSVTGGTGVTVTSGEVAIGQAVGTTDSVVFGGLQVTGNAVIDGNLQVNGTQTTISSQTLSVEDNMFYLNQLESSGSPTIYVDIGFAGNYNDTGSYAHAGFFRDATDGVWKLFDGYTPEPDSDLDIDVNHGSFSFADLTVGTLTASAIAGASFTGSYAGFDSDLGTKTTDDIAEGDNLYYTTARVDSDLGDILQAGTGITITNGDGIYTIGGVNAAADGTTKGIATFNSTHFSASLGVVSAEDITLTAGDTNTTAFTIGEGISILGNATSGVTTEISGANIVVSSAAATVTQRGTASFDSDQFEVTSGAVSLVEVDGGDF